MSDLFAYLKSHSDLSNLSANQRLLLIELSEQRFAAVLLRPSTIWKFAVVLGQIWQSVSWATEWRTAASQVSGEDARDLRRNGETPFGISIVEPLTREMNLLAQSLNLRNVDFVLPVGALSRMKNLIWLLDRKRFPRAKILESQPQLMLPNDLNVPNLREAIARVWPPEVDAKYTVQTVKLVSTAQGARLETETTSLINQGAAPPTQANPMEGVNRKKLFRAVSLPPGQTAPIYLIIKKGDTSAHVRCGNPSFNRFFLDYWINYRDDTLGIKVTDDKGDEIPGFNPVSPQEEAERAIAHLPDVESVRYLDLAFIVDGTMRAPADKNWKPDLEPARRFLDGLLDDLQKDKSLNVRVALYVYGDWPRAEAEFVQYTLPSHVKDFWCEPRILQREIQDPAKFKGTFDLDYEALLEAGLHWANTLQWRQDVLAARHVVVIGSAPPHLPDSDPYYPPDSGLTHEPFTSHFNYRDELKRLRGDPNSQQRTHIWAVWVPYPELEPTHPCQAWSRRIWDEVADHNPDAFIEGLGDDARGKLFERIKTHTSNRYVTRAPIPLPLTQQEHSLRWTRSAQ
jgi:hypothetical protein